MLSCSESNSVSSDAASDGIGVPLRSPVSKPELLPMIRRLGGAGNSGSSAIISAGIFFNTIAAFGLMPNCETVLCRRSTCDEDEATSYCKASIPNNAHTA